VVFGNEGYEVKTGITVEGKETRLRGHVVSKLCRGMSLEESGQIHRPYIPFLQGRFVPSGWVACDADLIFH